MSTRHLVSLELVKVVIKAYSHLVVWTSGCKAKKSCSLLGKGGFTLLEGSF